MASLIRSACFWFWLWGALAVASRTGPTFFFPVSVVASSVNWRTHIPDTILVGSVGMQLLSHGLGVEEDGDSGKAELHARKTSHKLIRR